jgi:hypothetical protein
VPAIRPALSISRSSAGRRHSREVQAAGHLEHAGAEAAASLATYLRPRLPRSPRTSALGSPTRLVYPCTFERPRSSICHEFEHPTSLLITLRLSSSMRHGSLRWAPPGSRRRCGWRQYGTDQAQIAHCSHGNGQTAYRLAAQRLDRIQQLCSELFDPCGKCRRVGSQCDGPESALGQRALPKSVLLHL